MKKLSKITILLLIIPIVVASWIIVHFLAIFGILLAIAYPIWWLIAPKKTVCLLCRAEGDGARCPFCHRHINKNESLSPKNLTSAVLNGILILLFSLICMVVVLGESKLLGVAGFRSSEKTAYFSIPTKGQYRIGEVFPMKIEINGITEPVNAIQADLGFDPKKVEIMDISTQDSFATIFIQKEINNEGGYARLTGGLPNPGFSGDKGFFGTIYFRAKSPGLVTIEYLPTSLVLANNGRADNILRDLASVAYLILPEKVTKEEEEKQSNMLLSSSVLGESTPEAQMKFYEETEVLGTHSPNNNKTEITPLTTSFVNAILNVDSFIVSQWANIISPF